MMKDPKYTFKSKLPVQIHVSKSEKKMLPLRKSLNTIEQQVINPLQVYQNHSFGTNQNKFTERDSENIQSSTLNTPKKRGQSQLHYHTKSSKIMSLS